ncbi:heterokaryon incompatibility protein-domain-containing protein [Microdochium trichocladiopsis]|uniref:Heterokaryon incompatibility protein-domain-containing protein n=1 Tax=Microdochium trichocladiopsis TaxID=1682393 RepID=A0A9P9BKR3_9PEZI|nr:heterokaryon incompatibility protein-domain-containing protein [Microdochium trichocladiopsis]KAH7021524.1 heterokaryon incompatibility protein-domain-containing protein [Microdochium trichocladiopsis]
MRHADKMEPARRRDLQVLRHATRPPLGDASKQIRLLKIDPGGFDDEIRCTITTCALGEVSEFNAISYTWGPEQPQRDIFINGLRFPVRHNCHYALQQARQYQSSVPIWIDSVCIDQNNLHEKGAQVGIMGDVYARAATVLACIGQDDEASDFIEAVLEEMQTHSGDNLWSHELDQDELFAAFWQSCDAAKRSELRKRRTEFCDRPYFHRVWVVQELFEGRGRIVVLCGRFSLPWDRLYLYDQLLAFAEDTASSWSKLNLLTLPLPVNLGGFGFINGISSQLLCEDPRDRIYGMLRLINYETHGVPQIVPDYNLSRLQLASKLIHDGHFSYIVSLKALIQALELTDKDIASSCHLITAIQDETRDWLSDIRNAFVIQSHDDGQLYTEALRASSTIQSSLGVSFHGYEPSKIYGPAGIVALACPGTMAGDILLETEFFDAIVRPHKTLHEYRVVGQAAIFRDSVSISPSFECSCWRENSGYDYSSADVMISFQAGVQEALSQAILLKSASAALSATTSSKEGFKEDLGRFRMARIPVPGSILRDVTIEQRFTREPNSYKIREWRSGCPRHKKESKTYHEAARRGPLSFLAASNGGQSVVFIRIGT